MSQIQKLTKFSNPSGKAKAIAIAEAVVSTPRGGEIRRGEMRRAVDPERGRGMNNREANGGEGEREKREDICCRSGGK